MNKKILVITLLFTCIAQGFAELKETKNYANEVSRLLELANTQQYNNLDSAKLLVDHALQLVTENRINRLLPLVYNQYGDFYLLNGTYELSYQNYEKARTLLQEFEDEPMLAKSLYGIGTTYYFRENYTKAFKFYDQCTALMERVDDIKGISDVYNNVGNIYFYQGDVQRAIEYAQRCVDIDRQLNNKEGLGYSYSNLGRFYYELDSLGKALEFHTHALAIREEVGNKLQMAGSYNNLAYVYEGMGQYEKAINLYKKALEIKQTFNNPYEIAVTLNNLGDLLININDFEQAYRVLKRAESALKLTLREHTYCENKLYLSALYEHMDSLQLAMQYLKDYHSVKDSLRQYAVNKELNSGELISPKINRSNDQVGENANSSFKYYSIIVTILLLIFIALFIKNVIKSKPNQ